MNTKMEETKFSKIKRNIENHPLLAVLLFIGVIIVGAGALTDSLDKIFSFSKKHLSSNINDKNLHTDVHDYSAPQKIEPDDTLPDINPIDELKSRSKVIAPSDKNEEASITNKILPVEIDPSPMSGARLLTVLKPAYISDRLSIIKESAPKLVMLSSSELQEILKLLYKSECVDGLQVLLPYIQKSLTDKEIDTVLELFYSSDIPKAVSLLTNSK